MPTHLSRAPLIPGLVRLRLVEHSSKLSPKRCLATLSKQCRLRLCCRCLAIAIEPSVCTFVRTLALKRSRSDFSRNGLTARPLPPPSRYRYPAYTGHPSCHVPELNVPFSLWITAKDFRRFESDCPQCTHWSFLSRHIFKRRSAIPEPLLRRGYIRIEPLRPSCPLHSSTWHNCRGYCSWRMVSSRFGGTSITMDESHNERERELSEPEDCTAIKY